MPEGVPLAAVQNLVALLGLGALGDDDDRRVVQLEARLDVAADLVDVEGHLGDEDDVRAAGHARVQRDPARVPAHDLDDQDAVVALRGGVQPVDGLGGDVDRGVEAERVVRAREVVVDRLRHADDVDARLVQLGGDAEGVFAADGDQRVDAEVLQVAPDPLHAVLDGERVGPRRAEDGAAPREQPAHGRDVQRHGGGLERPAPAVTEPEERVAVLGDALANDGPDHRVEPGAVPASGEHADAHVSHPLIFGLPYGPAGPTLTPAQPRAWRGARLAASNPALRRPPAPRRAGGRRTASDSPSRTTCPSSWRWRTNSATARAT